MNRIPLRESGRLPIERDDKDMDELDVILEDVDQSVDRGLLRAEIVAEAGSVHQGHRGT